MVGWCSVRSREQPLIPPKLIEYAAELERASPWTEICERRDIGIASNQVA